MSFMAWQKNFRMRIGYRFFGNLANLHNRASFNFLRDKISPDFLNQNICDLGCGDGVTTLEIKKVFCCGKIWGYENNDYLIKRAQQRGLSVIKMDLDEQLPTGDMAIIWGVVHHLKDKEKFLTKIKTSFQLAVFNEPVKNFWAFMDGGEPLTEKDWRNLFTQTLGQCQFWRFKDNLFVFWKK